MCFFSSLPNSLLQPLSCPLRPWALCLPPSWPFLCLEPDASSCSWTFSHVSPLCFSLLFSQASLGRALLSVVPLLCCFPSSAGHLDKWRKKGKLPIVYQTRAFCWYWSFLKILILDQILHPVYLKYNWVSSSSDDWQDGFWVETELGNIPGLKNVLMWPGNWTRGGYD